MVGSHLFGFGRNLRDCCYCSLPGYIRHGPLCVDSGNNLTTARGDLAYTTIRAAKALGDGKLGAVVLHRALGVADSTLGRHLGDGLAGRAAWPEERLVGVGRRHLGREVAGSKGHRSLAGVAACDGRG